MVVTGELDPPSCWPSSSPGEALKPVKHAVSFIVRRGPPSDPELLAVERPPDDEELPDVWGLPAASLRPGESWWGAVRRAGRDKLGLELGALRLRNQGRAVRAEYTLRMRLFEGEVTGGEPSVKGPPRDPDVTRYTRWSWMRPERLVEAAEHGSLCTRLCLDWLAGSPGTTRAAFRTGSGTPGAVVIEGVLATDELVRVEGTVVRGHRVASGGGPEPFLPGGTIRAQLSAFRERGLDLSGSEPGTLNVSLAPGRLAWERARATFRDVKWHPDLPPESFSFSPCRIEPAGPGEAAEGEPAWAGRPGWLYRPHPETKPRHHQPEDVVEVIAERLEGVGYGSRLTLAVDPWEVRVAGEIR